VANTLDLFRNGAVGFIDLLDADCHAHLASRDVNNTGDI